VQNLLAEHAGEAPALQIIAAVGGLERFFARDFVACHNRLYRGRPVFWCFSAGEKMAVIHALTAERAEMRRMFRWLGAAMPAGWKRSDDGIAANLAPLAPWLADAKLAAALTDQSRMRRRIRSSSATASTPG
jgi:hypothetical protein